VQIEIYITKLIKLTMNIKTLGLVVTSPLLVFYGLKHNDEMHFPQLGILMKRYKNTP
jgi:hypothetical protein